jgi:hypothetical protein
MAVTPQRMVYDRIPLLWTARTPRQLLLLVECSWAGFCHFFSLTGGILRSMARVDSAAPVFPGAGNRVVE